MDAVRTCTDWQFHSGHIVYQHRHLPDTENWHWTDKCWGTFCLQATVFWEESLGMNEDASLSSTNLTNQFSSWVVATMWSYRGKTIVHSFLTIGFFFWSVCVACGIVWDKAQHASRSTTLSLMTSANTTSSESSVTRMKRYRVQYTATHITWWCVQTRRPYSYVLYLMRLLQEMAHHYMVASHWAKVWSKEKNVQ